MAKKSKSTLLFRYAFILTATLLLGTSLLFWIIVFKPNTQTADKKLQYLFIKTGSTMADVMDLLKKKNLLLNDYTFEWLATFKGYDKQIRPGKYLIKKGMNNNQLINILKAGIEEQIKINFYNLHTKEQIAARIARNIEADSASIVNYLNNKSKAKQFGFDKESFACIITPNEIDIDTWATNTDSFFKLMRKEFHKFWDEERKSKAQKLGLTIKEVYILASIVHQEQTLHTEERPTIAGVYLNRYKQGMKLQADPTLIFACGDFTINRVLNRHIFFDSPYNTYKYDGLPPGPICVPSINAIDAVLNSPQHNYLYFCAKSDLSGFHNFAKTYNEHLFFAKKYQKSLNTKGIFN